MEKTVTNGNNDARRGGEPETNAAPNNQGNNHTILTIGRNYFPPDITVINEQ